MPTRSLLATGLLLLLACASARAQAYQPLVETKSREALRAPEAATTAAATWQNGGHGLWRK